MKYDAYGQGYTDSKELCELLYAKPNLDLSLFKVEDSLEYNASVASLHAVKGNKLDADYHYKVSFN